jgi:Methyltransferase domain
MAKGRSGCTTAALDFGCGKFRYTIPLSRQANSVYAVDSHYQIERIQRICGKQLSLIAYARKNLPNVNVMDVNTKTWRQRRYDFVLCANVLSVMPTTGSRLKALVLLRGCLKSSGVLLVCTQFRNTHFDGWASNPQARWHKGGWLVCGRRGYSFYAILPPAKLTRLCRAAGLRIRKAGTHGEAAFVFAGRAMRINKRSSLLSIID